MIGPNTGWLVAAVCALLALLALAYMQRRVWQWRERAASSERRLNILSDIAPQLTEAASFATERTCERIVDRFAAMLRAEVVLCFLAVDGRLRLAAKSDVGYAAFLRLGQGHEGDDMLTWAVHNAMAAVSGPTKADLPPGVTIADMSSEGGGTTVSAPLVGSRDRVWALCLPLLQHRGYGLRPTVIGAVYLERKRASPFSHDDLRTAATVGRLAADALMRSQFADEVRRESEIDPLTQLLTAATFRKRLRHELESRQFTPAGAGRDVALFFIDTDNFKTWNDSFGHLAGDVLLKRLAKIFAEVAHSGGFAGRNGGDEFCIALFDRTKDDAIAVAEALCTTIEGLDDVQPAAVMSRPAAPVTVSIGVAHFPVDVAPTASIPSDALLEAADARMYEAKRAGRNRVAYSRTRALPTKIRYPGEGPIQRR